MGGPLNSIEFSAGTPMGGPLNSFSAGTPMGGPLNSTVAAPTMAVSVDGGRGGYIQIVLDLWRKDPNPNPKSLTLTLIGFMAEGGSRGIF